jgi:hypothetical protein
MGYALAGAFPADVDENTHFLGALLIMGIGNIGLLTAGFAPRRTALGHFRAFTLSMGLIALAGSVLFFAQQGSASALAAWSCGGVPTTHVGLVCRRRNPRPLHTRPGSFHGQTNQG